jgi:hypothetical protein
LISKKGFKMVFKSMDKADKPKRKTTS